MMTTHVVSSVSGRSASSSDDSAPAPDDWSLDDVIISFLMLAAAPPGVLSAQVNVVVAGEEEEGTEFFEIDSQIATLHVAPGQSSHYHHITDITECYFII